MIGAGVHGDPLDEAVYEVRVLKDLLLTQTTASGPRLIERLMPSVARIEEWLGVMMDVRAA